jgi:hypothetical protein
MISLQTEELQCPLHLTAIIQALKLQLVWEVVAGTLTSPLQSVPMWKMWIIILVIPA